jgi:hypothetical protein
MGLAQAFSACKPNTMAFCIAGISLCCIHPFLQRFARSNAAHSCQSFAHPLYAPPDCKALREPPCDKIDTSASRTQRSQNAVAPQLGSQ